MKTRRVLHIVFAALAIAIDVFLIVEAAMNGSQSSMQSEGFTQMLINLIKVIDPNSPLLNDLGLFHSVVRKVFGHFLSFGASGLFTTLSLLMLPKSTEEKKLKTIIISLSLGLFLSLLTECIQLFTAERAGQFTDVIIDFSGFLLFSSLIYLLFYFIFKNKNKKKVEEE